jgi:hypothetical protein
MDDTAETEMRRWEISSSASVSVLSIDGDPLFYAIWEAKILQNLNVACGTTIDDYEEETIEPTVLPDAIESLASTLRTIEDPVIVDFTQNLISLLRVASANKRPVFFVL